VARGVGSSGLDDLFEAAVAGPRSRVKAGAKGALAEEAVPGEEGAAEEEPILLDPIEVLGVEGEGGLVEGGVEGEGRGRQAFQKGKSVSFHEEAVGEGEGDGGRPSLRSQPSSLSDAGDAAAVPADKSEEAEPGMTPASGGPSPGIALSADAPPTEPAASAGSLGGGAKGADPSPPSAEAVAPVLAEKGVYATSPVMEGSELGVGKVQDPSGDLQGEAPVVAPPAAS
jgi:hypothetical protein